jgi:hypothetical protein
VPIRFIDITALFPGRSFESDFYLPPLVTVVNHHSPSIPTF